MKNIIVITGEDTSQIKNQIDTIKKSVLGTDFMNVSSYDFEDSILLSDVLEDAATLSFLSDKKIVICENATFLNATGSLDETDTDLLLRYIQNPNLDSTLIFTSPRKLDVRKKIVKKLKEESSIIELTKIDEKNIKPLLKNQLESNGYQIDYKELDYLASLLGKNIDGSERELEKLMLYQLDDKRITKDAIDQVITKPDKDIFALIDLVTKKDLSQVIELYEKQFKYEEEPIKIIVTLANQFRLIYQVKSMKEEGVPEQVIAKTLGIHPYRVKLAGEKGRNFSDQELLRHLYSLAELDLGIKTGTLNKDVALDLYFLNLV